MTSFERKRLAANLTQEKLAKLVGVSAMSIARWEQGVSRPRTGSSYFTKLAKTLKVTPEELVDICTQAAEQNELASK